MDIEKILNKIHVGHNVDFIRDNIPDNSIDIVITSPPYDGLRTYNGFMLDIPNLAFQLFRVLKEGGVCVWVVNDATIDGCETLTSFKQAIFFVEVAGFKLHDTMLYAKDDPQTPPEVMKRYASEFEYMFVFTKKLPPKTFNPIKLPTKWGGMVASTGFRQEDGSIRNTKMRPIAMEKIIGNIWYYNVGYNSTTTDKIAFEHPAIFPEKLVEDHLKTWSNEGDVVLDPFMGSGTTAKVAHKWGRKFIGIDVSEEYVTLANKRISDTVNQLDAFGFGE